MRGKRQKKRGRMKSKEIRTQEGRRRGNRRAKETERRDERGDEE